MSRSSSHAQPRIFDNPALRISRRQRYGRTLQTVTLVQDDGQQEDLVEMLCPPCRQKLIYLISKDCDIQLDHLATAPMDFTGYKRRIRNPGPPPELA